MKLSVQVVGNDRMIIGKIVSCELSRYRKYAEGGGQRKFSVFVIAMKIQFDDGRIIRFSDIGQNAECAASLKRRLINESISPDHLNDIITDFVNDPEAYGIS